MLFCFFKYHSQWRVQKMQTEWQTIDFEITAPPTPPAHPFCIWAWVFRHVFSWLSFVFRTQLIIIYHVVFFFHLSFVCLFSVTVKTQGQWGLQSSIGAEKLLTFFPIPRLVSWKDFDRVLVVFSTMTLSDLTSPRSIYWHPAKAREN